MVVANFGMGIRPSSSVVQTDQERQNDFYARQTQLAAEEARLQQSLQARASDLAKRNVQNTISLGYSLTPQQQQNILNFITPAYMGDKNLRDLGGSPWAGAGSGGIADLNQQKLDNSLLNQNRDDQRSAPALFSQQEADRASSQQSQQAAYNGFQGGAVGGVLGRTSQAGMNDPTQPTASMPWGQPWSTPGFGNPGSLGGLGGYKPSGQQGWGSVFGGGRNPWSLA